MIKRGYWISMDWEFLEDGSAIYPISLGAERDDGKTYYAVNSDFDIDYHKKRGVDPDIINWLEENVMNKLDITEMNFKPIAMIAAEFQLFSGKNPYFIANHCSYDWVCTCQMYGSMIMLPKSWPTWCWDTKQLEVMMPNLKYRLPEKPKNLHNALDDAKFTHRVFNVYKPFLDRIINFT